MKKVILVKIGGGVITDKHQRYGLRPKILSRIAGEISRGYRKSKNIRIIVGNGAGSYAHWSAKKYRTAEGFSDIKGKIGAGVVHHDAVKLNQIVTEEIIKHDMPGFSLSPSSFMFAENGELKKVCIDTVENALELGMIPVVYGDVILDSIKGSCIFSTEKVFSIISSELGNVGYDVRIVHVSREDGVLINRKVVKIIDKINFAELRPMINGSSGVDVTGGMTHKVMESLSLAEKGIESVIINGLKAKRLERAMLGKRVIGTKIG